MKKILKLILIILVALIIFGLIIASSSIYEGYMLYKEKASGDKLDEKINEIRKTENYVTYENIPKDFVNAVVAVEDHRFFEHNGIDIISIIRAIATNIKEMRAVEGGSTITQQVAKNLYFTQEKKLSRKVAEIFAAFDLEKKYSKEDIIEIYLNNAYFGDGHYGIYDAVHGYFSKDLSDLSLYEITLLAGLPNAPSVYALSNNSELSMQRQNMVIDAMVEYNYLTESKAKELKAKQ